MENIVCLRYLLDYSKIYIYLWLFMEKFLKIEYKVQNSEWGYFLRNVVI